MTNHVPEILREAIMYEKRELLIKDRAKMKQLSPSERLKILLPSYDQDNQESKPIPFHNAAQKERVIKGGVRSGKTVAAVADAVLQCYDNRPYTHLSLHPTADNARETYVKELEETLDREGYKYKHNKTDQTIKIYFFGNSKRDIGTIAYIGEGEFFRGVTAGSGDANEIFSLKPQSVKDWFDRISKDGCTLVKNYTGCPEPLTMKYGFEYVRDGVEEDKAFLAHTYIDRWETEKNKYLPAEYLESQKRKYTEKEQLVYLKGIYTNLSQGKVYHSFDVRKNVIPEREVEDWISHLPRINIFIGFDFNVDPMAATEYILGQPIGYVPKQEIGNEVIGKQAVQVAEYLIHNSNTDELCELIIQRLKIKYPGITKPDAPLRYSLTLTGDASGRSRKTAAFGKTDWIIIKEAFTRAGFLFDIRVGEENPPVKDRVNVVNKFFELEKALISSACYETIQDRNMVNWKQRAEGFVIDKSNNSVSHLSDAGDYALWIIQMYLRATETEESGVNRFGLGESRGFG